MNTAKLSNTQIDKIGKAVRSEKFSPAPKTLSKIQEFRISHKESLSEVFNALVQIKKKIKSQAIVTYRIKRFESIIGKLKRHPKMKLSRMWDIGGCRVILDNVEQVYSYAEEIKSILQIRKDDYDYIKNPQPDGYKSYHIFVNSPLDNHVIEIQLRCQEQHNWATLVEISDIIYNSKLKEYGKDKTLLRFHFLLSKDSLIIEEKKELARIIKKYKYVERLNSVFSRNYLMVRLQWLLIEFEYKHKFFLIETKRDEIPTIEAYDDFKKAENAYFNKFKENDNANIVLTHILKPKYEQINIAYSNYFLTMHSCMNDFSVIFESLIIESIKESKYFDYLKYLSQYQEISVRKYANFVKENNITKNLQKSIFIKELEPKISKKITKRFIKKNKEWNSSIKSEIKLSNKKLKEFSILITKHRPQGKFKRYIFTQISKYTARKYSKIYKKLLKTI